MLFRKNRCRIIAGCGPLGAALARSWDRKGCKVVVIDTSQTNLRRLPIEFGGFKLEGDPTDVEVLEAAGIREAELFIASGGDDNTNLLLSQIASQIFGVKQVYARLDDAGKRSLIRDMPVEVISLHELADEDYGRLAETMDKGAAV